MLEKFIKAVKEKDINEIKNIIGNPEFDIKWLNDPNINNGNETVYDLNMMEGSEYSQPLIFYAIENGLDNIAKTLIANPQNDLNIRGYNSKEDRVKSLFITCFNHGNKEIINLLLGKETMDFPHVPNSSNKILKYFAQNEQVRLEDISDKLLKSLLELNKFDEIISVLSEKNIDWNYKFKDKTNILKYFYDKNDHTGEGRDSNLLDQLLTFIASLPNFNYVADFVYHVLNHRDFASLIEKHIGLVGDLLNTTSSKSILPLHESMIADYETLLAMQDKDGLPLLNVNSVSHTGRRLIDKKRDDDETVKILRNCGSVEPKELIIDPGNNVQKIVFDSIKSPDMIAGNKEKTVKIIKLFYQRYPLTEQQIDDEITWLKNSKNYSEYSAEWQDQGIDNVLKVIDKLASMTDENDRMPESWDFKKILGTIIHIVKNDAELISVFEDALSQLRMCSLSKLMNLLGVVQDKLLVDPYSKLEIHDFENVLKIIFENIESLGNKGPLFFAEWVNERLGEGNNKNPEKWNPATQKIQGIFNKTFAEHFKGVNNASYHFNDGLELKMIGQLKEFLMPGSTKASVMSKDHIVIKFVNLAQRGQTMFIDKYINELIDNNNLSMQNLTDFIEEVSFNAKLNAGDFSSINSDQIQNWINKLSQKKVVDIQSLDLVPDAVKQFSILLESGCTFNPEAQEYIANIIGENVAEQQS